MSDDTMTREDWFAAFALQGLLAGSDSEFPRGKDDLPVDRRKRTIPQYAKVARDIAREMASGAGYRRGRIQTGQAHKGHHVARAEEESQNGEGWLLDKEGQSE